MFNLSRMTEIFTIMIIVAVVLAVLLVILFIVEADSASFGPSEEPYRRLPGR
ncbi:MAG: hypothetical protein ACOX1A_05235 [Saccharofermentanales bacterium]